jgi:hypothetical protein
MTDRLRKLVNQVFDGYDGSPPPIRERLVNAFITAGVTLPPEPEIPVPEEAENAFHDADGMHDVPSGLRAAYPHIVAAVIDTLPTKRASELGTVVRASVPDLHRALKSSRK